MKTERQTIGSVEVLTPAGPLVDEDAGSFCAMLLERLTSPNPRVVLAFHEVPYVDSKAMEGLLDACDELKACGMSLKLAGVTPTCREIFEITCLASEFRFFNDVQDAVRSFV